MGVVLGALAMTKSDQIALGVVLVLPLVLAKRDVSLRRRLGWLSAAAAACVVIMAPWSIYLSNRFDRPVIVSGAVGATMASGNSAPTFSGELLGWYKLGCGLDFKDTNDPIRADTVLRDRALTFMRNHAGQLPTVVAARIGRTFSAFRPFQQLHLEYGSDIHWVAEWGLLEYWSLLPFAIAGIVVARRRKVALYPLLVFPFVVVCTVLLTIGSVRYRAPAEIPLVILAAVGCDAAIRAWWPSSRHRLPVSAKH